MVLKRADHLFMHNYIRSILNIILIILVWNGIETKSYYLLYINTNYTTISTLIDNLFKANTLLKYIIESIIISIAH